MKLAEALQERADLNRNIEQLRKRLNSNVLVIKLFDVPPEAFTPAPKVMSSVVRMVPIDRKSVV